MSLLILPCPNTGQQSRITTGPLRRAHLTKGAPTCEYRDEALAGVLLDDILGYVDPADLSE